MRLRKRRVQKNDLYTSNLRSSEHRSNSILPNLRITAGMVDTDQIIFNPIMNSEREPLGKFHSNISVSNGAMLWTTTNRFKRGFITLNHKGILRQAQGDISSSTR